jgi:hypothetical protein
MSVKRSHICDPTLIEMPSFFPSVQLFPPSPPLAAVLLAALFATNAVISAILVWRRGAGTTSVTVFLTNIGLLLRVLYKSIDQVGGCGWVYGCRRVKESM